MKLEIPVKVYFDDVQGMIDEIQKLQTYKLFEGDDMVLVNLDAVATIMANHIRATDKCSETPNGWVPCSERLPESFQEVLVCGDNGDMDVIIGFTVEGIEGTWVWQMSPKLLFVKDIVAWQPLPTPYQEEGDKDGR